MNMLITKENTQELIAKGWSIKEHTFPSGQKDLSLIHPILAPERNGGYSNPKHAFEKQEEYDFKLAGKTYHYVTTCRFGLGYGFNITELTPTGERNFIMNVATKELASQYVEIFNAMGKGHSEIHFNNETQYLYLMILKEKHGDRYFSVPTLEILLKTCRAIVVDRIESDCYYCDVADDIHLTPEPQFSREEIAKWKDGTIKEVALHEWESFDKEKAYRENIIEQTKALDFVKNNDTIKACIKAYDILVKRKSYEYERLEFEAFENILENESV
jgi:hypothetical protein